MSTAAVVRGRIDASPGYKARWAGVFYLLTIVTGVIGFVVDGRLVVTGDAVATATRILGHETLYRFGFAVDLLATSCYIAVTALFYGLFKPVSRSLSLLAAFFSLVGCAMGAVSALFHGAPLALLKGVPYLNVFRIDQLQALALTFLRFGAQATSIGLVFFGFYCLLIGYLIWRSTFLPRLVGALMMLAGLGWLTFLVPPFANAVVPYNMAFGFLGESTLTACLLAAGVNVPRWKERARAAGEPVGEGA